MTLGVSSHRIEHWFFMGEGRKFDSDVPETAGRDALCLRSDVPERLEGALRA